MGKNKTNLLVVLIVVLVLVNISVVIFFGYLFYNPKNKIVSQQSDSSSNINTQQLQPNKKNLPDFSDDKKVEEPQGIETPSLATEMNHPDAIREAMAQKHDKRVEQVELEIDVLNPPYAKGGVRFQGEMGGGWFLAYQEDDQWVITADGNGTVPCQAVEPYDFPISMVSECWDEATSSLITR